MRAARFALAAIAVACALLFARPHSTPGPAMRDFEAYYAAGRTWSHGGNPYGVAIWKAERRIPGVDPHRYEVLPFVGPPATLPLWGLLARLPFASAIAVWGAVLGASLAVVILVTLRLLEMRVSPLAFGTLLLAALAFGPVTSGIALGQVVLPAFASALLALAWLERNALAAGIATVFAALQPNVALVLLARLRRLRSWPVFAAAFLAFELLAAAAGGGFRTLWAYQRLLGAQGAAEAGSTIQTTPYAIASGFGAGHEVATFVALAAGAAAIFAWAALVVRKERGAGAIAITCALLPFAVPFFHEQDLTVAYFAAIFAVARADARRWPIAAAGALLVTVDWLGLAQRPDGVLQTFLLAVGALLAYAALRRDVRSVALAAPLGVLVLLALAGTYAQAHPAPIWPDAMGALPPIPPGTPLASIWHAEQRATGLFAPNAFWALLRCGPLFGCGLLAYCCAAASSQPQISTSIMLSNGVTWFGWKFRRSRLKT